MSIKKGFFGAVGLALLALGLQLPAQAQSLSESKPSAVQETYQTPLSKGLLDEALAESIAVQPVTSEAEALADATFVGTPEASAADLAYPMAEEEAIAQTRRRRTRGEVAGSPAFIGIGGDLGTTDDLSFAVISKLAVSRQVAIRPSVLIGEDFAVLVPVTYEFSRFNTSAGRVQFLPYAGVGASYIDSDDSSELGLLLSGGVDIPISRRFTANAQANYAGIFSDSENLGVTLGVGYNFGGFGR